MNTENVRTISGISLVAVLLLLTLLMAFPRTKLLAAVSDRLFGVEAWAASVRLDDQTTLTADVLQADDEDVILRLPRENVKTVDGKPLPAPLVAGMPAPAFQVIDIEGRPQSLGAARGPVTVLHFWVSWCPHCRSDAPKIQALHNQFAQNPQVRVLTVSLDQQRAKLDQFVKDRQVTYPVISAQEQGARPGGADLAALYHITSFPITILIDGQGTIREKVKGSFVESGVDLEATVKGLLPTS